MAPSSKGHAWFKPFSERPTFARRTFAKRCYLVPTFAAPRLSAPTCVARSSLEPDCPERPAIGDGCAIPAELLRQHSGSFGEESRLVIEMAFYEDQRAWGWLKLLSAYGNRADWALAVLAKSVRDGDNAPELLRCLTADSSETPATATTSTTGFGDSVRSERGGNDDLDPSSSAKSDDTSGPRMLWTCRRTPIYSTSGTLRQP